MLSGARLTTGWAGEEMRGGLERKGTNGDVGWKGHGHESCGAGWKRVGTARSESLCTGVYCPDDDVRPV